MPLRLATHSGNRMMVYLIPNSQFGILRCVFLYSVLIVRWFWLTLADCCGFALGRQKYIRIFYLSSSYLLVIVVVVSVIAASFFSSCSVVVRKPFHRKMFLYTVHRFILIYLIYYVHHRVFLVIFFSPPLLWLFDDIEKRMQDITQSWQNVYGICERIGTEKQRQKKNWRGTGERNIFLLSKIK